MYGGSAIKVFSSHTVLTDVIAAQKVVFWHRRDIEQVARGLNGSPIRATKIALRSHKGTSSVTGGWRRMTPLRNLTTMELEKTDFP